MEHLSERDGEAGAAAAAEVVVRAEHVAKSIDERAVLRDVSFAISAGEYVALLGANGAGKSTLLKILATLIPATGGRVELFGRVLDRRGSAEVRGKVGMIGHQAMLYRDLSARENLEFFAKLYGVADPGRRARAMLEMVGLSSRGGDAVKTYSRGMAQRVSIARALLHDPALLLADEPFAGLDAPSTRALEMLLDELHSAGKTIVLVNHDVEQTLRIAERAIVLRDGRVAVDSATHRLYAQEVLSEVA